ncbi:hypothetical protein D9758_003450 [Tetrapyrgos nigripes]|uniref:F-box domain-containing protein n=1 Tax=Tetrapyrgos nigripes TaxID=182062 RepID=A0A8H5GVD1_9AGAR|nr:hypothetical protein D9758_003450 [Tetrapyrgos nigripes]
MTVPPDPDVERIYTLLRCNYGAYNPDSECISQLLSNTERDIRLGNVGELEQRGLEWKASRYRSLLAPMRKIPPELLVLLFEFFCGEGATFREELWSPPVRISHVCAGWRDLARSTPNLWSKLHIEDLSLLHYSPEIVIFRLAMHLELSQQTPLDLFIAMNRVSSRYREPVQLIVDMLFAQSPRWREVNLDLPSFVWKNLDDLRGKLGLLRFLEISDWDYKPDLQVFETAYSLREIDLSFSAVGLRLPWTQITDITLGCGTGTDALEGMRLATAARAVTLHKMTLIFFPGESRRLVHNLHSLSFVVGLDDPHFHYFLKRLTLHNLASLSISGDESIPYPAWIGIFNDKYHDDDSDKSDDEDDEDGYEEDEYDDRGNGGSIQSFLSRSSCTITSLSLIDFPIRDYDAIALLSMVPSLSSLTIHEPAYERSVVKPDVEIQNVTVSGRLLDWLTIKYNHAAPSDTNSPPDLPLRHLRSLDLRVLGTFPAKAIIDVVASRCTGNDLAYPGAVGVDKLDEVKVLVLRSTDDMVLDVEELHDSLKALRNLGLMSVCDSRPLEKGEL